MKKYIAVLLACVCLFLSACASSGSSVSETTTAPTVTTAPVSSVIDLREYDCGVDNSVFNADTLKELIRQADEILNSGEEFWLDNNYYLNYLCVCAPAAIPARRGSKIVVDLPFEGRTDLQIEYVRYLFVLQFITQEYADCIYAKRVDPVTTQLSPKMYLLSDFSQSGYNTVNDYYRALDNGECEWDEYHYAMDMTRAYIFSGRDVFDDRYGPLVDEVLQAQQEN